MTRKPINLDKLAVLIAKSDNPAGKNIDVVDVRIVLRALGDLLTDVSPNAAFHICDALTAPRASRKGPYCRKSKD